MVEQNNLHASNARVGRLDYLIRSEIDLIIALGTPLAIGLLIKVAGHAPEPALTYAWEAETIAAGTASFVRLFQIGAVHLNGSEDQWSVQLGRAEDRGMDAIKAAKRTVSLQTRNLARTLTRKLHISS